jgi:hypothetical protein
MGGRLPPPLEVTGDACGVLANEWYLLSLEKCKQQHCSCACHWISLETLELTLMHLHTKIKLYI